MKQTLLFLKHKDLYLGLMRYMLAITMLPYALTKILKTQFSLPGFALTQLQSLETMSGTTIAWAFLGYSLWFQVLLGFLELIPAIMLLFRRTTLLGATLLLPVTLNVFLINYALNLWDETKLISSILLILNISVLLFEWAKIKSLLMIMMSKSSRFNFNKIEISVNIIILTVVGYLASKPLIDYSNQRNELSGDWLNKQPIEWTLEKEESGDSTLANRDLKVYYGAYGKYDESGKSHYADDVSYTIDTLNKTIKLKYAENEVVNCNYYILSDNELKIERLIDSSKNHVVTQYFRKRIINNDRN